MNVPPPTNTEVDAWMLLNKTTTADPSKSIGAHDPANPKFIYFSERDAFRALNFSNEIRAIFHVVKVKVKFEGIAKPKLDSIGPAMPPPSVPIPPFRGDRPV